MTTLTNQSGQSIQLAQELGRGGEGAVFALAGRGDLVAKLYHPEQRTRQREAKLAVMVANPPRNARAITVANQAKAVLPALAWPNELLYLQGQFAGFVMPRIDRCPNIFEVYNPKLRSLRYPKVDRRFLHHAARNLAIVLAGLHASGYVMGDVNQKNILVNPQAMVTLVDADSFQVADGNGAVYRCGVGVPEYTPPELQGKVLAQVDRRPQHDCFGLGVLLFQLLMEGYHPFTGRPVSSNVAEVSQLSIHCIQYGIFPYQANRDVQPPPSAPNFCWLHPDLQQLFVATFLLGHLHPENRPNALAWAQALGNAEENLERCERNPNHWFSRHLERCPYCAKTQTLSQAAAIPSHRPTYYGWQPKAQQSQKMPIGCWVDILNMILLPLLVVLGIPLLLWMIHEGWGILPIAILGGLARAGLLKPLLPWLHTMLKHTWRGAQLGWRWLTQHVSQDALLGLGILMVVGAVLVGVVINAVPKAQPPLPPRTEVRVTVTETANPASILIPISPLTVVSPLQTPSP